MQDGSCNNLEQKEKQMLKHQQNRVSAYAARGSGKELRVHTYEHWAGCPDGCPGYSFYRESEVQA
jgi:hypothetical protein